MIAQTQLRKRYEIAIKKETLQKPTKNNKTLNQGQQRADQERERERPVFTEEAMREVANGRRQSVVVKFVSIEKGELARWWCGCG